jgi:ATPase family associated with various cellular activities (AAA)
MYPFVSRDINAWKQKVINKHYPTEVLLVIGPSGCGKSTLIKELLTDPKVQLLRFGFEDRDKIAGCWSDIKHGQKPRVLWIDEVEAFQKSDFGWLSKLDTQSAGWPGFQSARYIVLSGNTDAYTIKNKLLKSPSKMLDAIGVQIVTFPIPKGDSTLKAACQLVSVPLDDVSRESWKVNPGDLRRLSTRNFHRSDDNYKRLSIFQVFPMFAAEMQKRVLADVPEQCNSMPSVKDADRFDSFKVGHLDDDDSGFDDRSYQKALSLADHDLVFPYLYHNYPSIVANVDKARRSLLGYRNTKKRASQREEATVTAVIDIATISDLLSMSDTMDQSIHRDGFYDLQDYHTFLQSVYPMAVSGNSGETTFPSDYLRLHGEVQKQASAVSEFSTNYASKIADECGSQNLLPLFTSQQTFVLETEPFLHELIHASAPTEVADALAGKDADALTALNSLLRRMHISPGGFERLIKWAKMHAGIYEINNDPLASTIGKRIKDCIISNLKPVTVDKNPKNAIIKEFAPQSKPAPKAKALQTIAAAPKKTNKRKASEEVENKFANKRQKTAQSKITFAPIKVTKKLAASEPAPVVTLESKLVLPKISTVFKSPEQPPNPSPPIQPAPVKAPTLPPMPTSGSFDSKKLSQMFQQSGLLSVIHPTSSKKTKRK